MAAAAAAAPCKQTAGERVSPDWSRGAEAPVGWMEPAGFGSCWFWCLLVLVPAGFGSCWFWFLRVLVSAGFGVCLLVLVSVFFLLYLLSRDRALLRVCPGV